MTGDPHLKARDLRVSFGSTVALDGIDLTVERGEIVAILGPSGCGKSTLLRAIAGLQPLEGGAVVLDGVDLTSVPPHRRGIGLMSQAHSLFPHRSVADNVAFGLELKPCSPSDRRARVEVMLGAVGLSTFGSRTIDALSGGEAQRVALARTLAPEPSLVMLDEPMGSLDRMLRERLAMDIRRTLRAEGVSALVVTHDQDEAFTICDRIAVMRDGRIEQLGDPTDLRRRPASAFVARFLGIDTFVEVEVGASGSFVLAGRELCRPDWPQGRATVAVPPEAVVADGAGAMSAVVGQQRFRGDHFVTELRIEGTDLTSNLLDSRQEGDTIRIAIEVDRLARVGG